jgi:outer membrane protein
MHRLAKPLSALVFMAALLPATALAGGIAVVDVQKVMESSKHWKDATAKLEKDRASRQAALEGKQKVLKDRKDKIDAAKAVSAPNATMPDEEKLLTEAQQLTQEYMQSQQELLALEKKVTDEMLSRVEGLVRQMASEADYAFVFEVGNKDTPNVLYSAPSLDITDRVIQSYDKYFKDKPLDLK